MLVATDDDLVIGMCMHYELVPTPAPTPTPIPHPFTATISDPSRKAAQAVVGPMKAASGEPPPPDRPFAVYGLPVANTGTITKNASVLPHVPLPPGTGWAPMPKPPKPMVGILETPPPPDLPVSPAGDALLDKGSGTVVFGLGDVVRLGDTAQSCSEPARQSSTVLAVPKGGPVLIGG